MCNLAKSHVARLNLANTNIQLIKKYPLVSKSFNLINFTTYHMMKKKTLT